MITHASKKNSSKQKNFPLPLATLSPRASFIPMIRVRSLLSRLHGDNFSDAGPLLKKKYLTKINNHSIFFGDDHARFKLSSKQKFSPSTRYTLTSSLFHSNDPCSIASFSTFHGDNFSDADPLLSKNKILTKINNHSIFFADDHARFKTKIFPRLPSTRYTLTSSFFHSNDPCSIASFSTFHGDISPTPASEK